MAHLGLNWGQHSVNYFGVTISINTSKNKFELLRLNLDSYCDTSAPKLNLWWANELLVDFDSINWPIIYKNNYYCTLETKL